MLANEQNLAVSSTFYFPPQFPYPTFVSSALWLGFAPTAIEIEISLTTWNMTTREAEC